MAYNPRGQYDVIVHPTAGVGDYTSIATALSTEGAGTAANPKRIAIMGGQYSESSNVTIESWQHIYTLGQVEITFADNVAMYVNTNATDIYLEGEIKLVKDAAGGLQRLFYAYTGVERFNSSNCKFILAPTFSGTVDTNSFFLEMRGYDCDYWFEAHDINFSYTPATNTAFAYNLVTHSRVKFSLVDSAVTTSNATNWFGISTWSTEQNILMVDIKGVTTSTGNQGYGMYFSASGDYNSVIGSVLGCDGGNIWDQSGGTNKTGEVVV